MLSTHARFIRNACSNLVHGLHMHVSIYLPLVRVLLEP